MPSQTSKYEYALSPRRKIRGLFSLWGLALEGNNDPFSRTFLEIIKSQMNPISNFHGEVLDFIVLIEPPKGQVATLKKKHPNAYLILVVFEPKAVRPDHYSRRTWPMYDKVLHLSKEQASGNPKATTWEIGFVKGVQIAPEEAFIEKYVGDNPKVALINANKFSFVPGSNYALRADFARLAISRGVDLTIAGKGWESGLIKNTIAQVKVLVFQVLLGARVNLRYFRTPIYTTTNRDRFAGEVESAIDFLRTFDIVVIIENDSTYVSEKLYNAILAGSLPIYVGPKLSEHGLPPELALETAGSSNAIIDAIFTVDKNRLARWGEFRRNWLSLESTHQRWSESQGIHNLVNKLIEVLTSEFVGKDTAQKYPHLILPLVPRDDEEAFI